MLAELPSNQPSRKIISPHSLKVILSINTKHVFCNVLYCILLCIKWEPVSWLIFFQPGCSSLLKRKRESFWTTKIDAERSSLCQLWHSIDALLGRGRASTLPAVVDNLHQFFNDKVSGVRESTDDTPPPSFSTVPPECSMHTFRSPSITDVVAAIGSLLDVQCSSDVLPIRILKENVDVLALFLAELYNRSLMLGVVPSAIEAAYITPLLKKPDLDPNDVKSYRPISNLPVLLKLLDRLIATQLLDHLTKSWLLLDLQSAYRANHSTETAIFEGID